MKMIKVEEIAEKYKGYEVDELQRGKRVHKKSLAIWDCSGIG